MAGHQLADLVGGARGAGEDRLAAQVAGKVVVERRDGRVAPGRLLLERLEHDHSKIRIEPRLPTRGRLQRERRLLADDPGRPGEIHSVEVVRQSPGQEPVQDDAERIDVGADVGLVLSAADLVGAHVGKGPLDAADLRDRARRVRLGIGDPGQPEIEDLDVGLGAVRVLEDEDVRRLQIPVDDAALVGVSHGGADLPEQGEPAAHLGPRIRGTVLVQVGGERPARHQLHGEEVLSLVRGARLVDRRDARVFEPGQAVGLALEHAYRARVDVPASQDHLERDRAPRPLLLGLVDHPHPAAADLAHHPVGPDRGAGEGLAAARCGVRAFVGCQGHGGEVDRGAQKGPGFRVRAEKVLDFGAQSGVPGAGPVQEGAAPVGRQIERLRQKRRDEPPAVGGRKVRHVASAPDIAR